MQNGELIVCIKAENRRNQSRLPNFLHHGCQHKLAYKYQDQHGDNQ